MTSPWRNSADALCVKGKRKVRRARWNVNKFVLVYRSFYLTEYIKTAPIGAIGAVLFFTKNIFLPAAHAADINVDEVILRVIANAAALKPQRNVTQLRGRQAGNANINRIAGHMQGLCRLRSAGRTQTCVRLRGAIGGNNVIFDLGLQI